MTKRWIAKVTYRSEHGTVDVDHEIEELDEIAEIVERGPDWNTIETIEIQLAEPFPPGLTLEQAASL